MSGSGHGEYGGYGTGSGSSADYGYGSRPYGSGSSSVPSTAGPYGQSDPFGQSDPYSQPASYGQPVSYGQPSTYGQSDPYAAYGGAPQAVDPYAGAYPGPVVYSRPTNTMAILSLVFSLVGLITYGFTCIVGVILGHVARSQIKRTGEQGAGLALSGLIVGYAFMGLVIIGVILYVLLISVALTTAS